MPTPEESPMFGGAVMASLMWLLDLNNWADGVRIQRESLGLVGGNQTLNQSLVAHCPEQQVFELCFLLACVSIKNHACFLWCLIHY